MDCEEATRFHDETSAVNHEDQMAGQSGRPPHQKESPLDRTSLEDAN